MTKHYDTLTEAHAILAETGLSSREILRQRNDLYAALENIIFLLHVNDNNPSEASILEKLDAAREHAAGLLTEIQA
jgi:hypothetical protein